MDKATYEIKSQMIDLKAQIGNLTQELKRIQVEHAEDRVFLKALNGTVDNLSAQVGNLDQQIEAGHKKAEAKSNEQQITKAAEEMSLTEIGELFKTDPAEAAEVMRQQGMNPSAGLGGLNPWVFNNRKEQELLEQVDPAKAAELKAQAATMRR